MRVLFVHQNFPAQYAHLSAALAARPGVEARALAVNARPSPAGVRVARYEPTPGGGDAHPLAADFGRKARHAEGAARAALALRAGGFRPDVVCGHPGWGETLYLRDVWPDARLLAYQEFHFSPTGGDFGFDPEFPESGEEARWRMRARNAPLLMSLADADWNVTPTRWQHARLPAFARPRTSVIHDGVDAREASPDPSAVLELGRGGALRPGDEVVTFVNRNLEPYRGFHTFMRALPEILRRRPRARVVVVGGDGRGYGPPPRGGGTWRQAMTAEVGARLDMSRVHFVGRVPRAAYLRLLQVSAAHVYLTYPFVLSWSLVEAMAAGCLVVASDTAPVREVVSHGRNGLLVDFFSPVALADATCAALADPAAHRGLREAARRTVLERYSLDACLPRQVALVEMMAAGRVPASPTLTEAA